MNNIILIGMPGAGKSTVGVVLAKVLGYRFIDTDLCIQEQEGMLLHQLIEEFGQDQFLEIENRCIASLECDNCVIATGGSAVYGKEAMTHLSKLGTIYYLELSYESIKERLGDLHERGVAIREGETLLSLYSSRCPLYEHYAKNTIACEGKTIREIVGEIRTNDKNEN